MDFPKSKKVGQCHTYVIRLGTDAGSQAHRNRSESGGETSGGAGKVVYIEVMCMGKCGSWSKRSSVTFSYKEKKSCFRILQFSVV
jgi:hypothetical protein